MPGQESVLAAAVLKSNDHMQCARKADLPARLHYGSNHRVPAFVCIAQPGWMIANQPPREGSRGDMG